MEFFSLRDVFRYFASLLFSRRRASERQEDLYSSTNGKDDLLGELDREGGYRKRVIHEVGPLASSDSTSWTEEHLKYWDTDNAVQHEIEHTQARRCNCGAILGYKNHILGTCMICGRIVCTGEGCAERCEYCNSLICGRHARKFGKHIFCSRHRAIAWWRLFWGYLE